MRLKLGGGCGGGVSGRILFKMPEYSHKNNRQKRKLSFLKKSFSLKTHSFYELNYIVFTVCLTEETHASTEEVASGPHCSEAL